MVNLKALQTYSPVIFTIVLMLSALVFTTSLAWNSAAQKASSSYFGNDDSLKGSLIFAFIMTMILILSAFATMKTIPQAIELV